MRDGSAYLNFLSDFWVSLWKDSPALSAVIGAQVELLNRVYLQAVAVAAVDYVEYMPLFREDFWHLFTFRSDQRQILSLKAEVDGQIIFKVPDYWRPRIRHATVNGGSEKINDYVAEDGRIIWKGAGLKKGDTVDFHSYAWFFGVGESIAYQAIPYMIDRPFSPTVTIRENSEGVNRDYGIIKRSDAGRLDAMIDFEVSPFDIPGVNSRDMGSYREVVFFAPKVYVDEEDLWQVFGNLARVLKPTSEDYRQMVTGVMYVYANGPALAPMNAGLNTAAGLPYSRFNGTDTVVGIYRDLPTHYIIQMQSGMAYDVRKGCRLAVTVGSKVKFFGTFTQDIKIMDHLSEPKWWTKTVNHIPPELVTNLTPQQRQDPAIIDYAFEKYLKHHTFGLEVRTTVLQDGFDAVEEFFRVVYEMKPAYASPYVRGYFPVQDAFTELVGVPGEDGQIYYHPKNQSTGEPILNFTEADLAHVRSTAYEKDVSHKMGASLELTRDQRGDAAERWARPVRVQLNGGHRVLASKGFENKRVQLSAVERAYNARRATAYEDFRLSDSWGIETHVGITDEVTRLNARRILGNKKRVGIRETLTVGQDWFFPDTMKWSEVRDFVRITGDIDGTTWVISAS